MGCYADIGLRANRSYIDALAAVENPYDAYQDFEHLCETAEKGHWRVRGINPLREEDLVLLEAIMAGLHHFTDSKPIRSHNPRSHLVPQEGGFVRQRVQYARDKVSHTCDCVTPRGTSARWRRASTIPALWTALLNVVLGPKRTHKRNKLF